MRISTLIAATLSLGAFAAPAAAAEPPQEAGPYAAAAVGDDLLAGVTGTALPSFARNVRALSDQNAQLYLRQTGETSRIVLDNWWAQTGAALIVNNILASPASR